MPQQDCGSRSSSSSSTCTPSVALDQLQPASSVGPDACCCPGIRQERPVARVILPLAMEKRFEDQRAGHTKCIARATVLLLQHVLLAVAAAAGAAALAVVVVMPDSCRQPVNTTAATPDTSAARVKDQGIKSSRKTKNKKACSASESLWRV